LDEDFSRAPTPLKGIFDTLAEKRGLLQFKPRTKHPQGIIKKYNGQGILSNKTGINLTGGLGDSTTWRNHKSFNGNLFMPSEWKNGILEYWA